jgi:hypothetical protein
MGLGEQGAQSERKTLQESVACYQMYKDTVEANGRDHCNAHED